MSVTVPPRSTDTHDDRDLERRVADLDALIEEARRRARRRRQRIGLAALVLAAAGAGLLIGFGAGGAGVTGTVASGHAAGAPDRASTTESPPLGMLPPGGGYVDGFAFDPRDPLVAFVLVAGPGRVVETTDGGAHWRATSGRGWPGANEALAADPRHPGTLYVGTSAGVVRTVDGGRTWRASNRGLLPPTRDPPDFRQEGKGRLVALVVDPGDSKVVYAGSDRISKSADGGRSWTTVFPSRPTQYRDTVSALAIAPTRPETIYAILSESVDGPTSIVQSNDAGATWSATKVVRGLQGGGLGFATALAVDPRHPATVYAALGATVVKTTDAGRAWQPIGHGLPIAAGLSRAGCHCSGGVTTLAADPRRPGTVYAALTQSGIYRTTNGGRTWAAVTPAGLYMYTVAIDPARPATIYAAGDSESGDGPRIMRSTNGGRTWDVAP